MSTDEVSVRRISLHNLHEVQTALREEVGEDFAIASDHPHNCTCDLCREWWRQMGPDPDTGLYGPFGNFLPDSG